MAEDLYNKWLGVPDGRRPPDAYALLNLPRFCDDRQAIDRAAGAQLGRLDAYAIHPDKDKRDACHRMMNEVAGAHVLLIDDRRREEYDQQLLAGDSDATAEMEAQQLDATLEMPAETDDEPHHPGPGGSAAADAHRLLRDVESDAGADDLDEDDPVVRAMAEVRGKPVLEETLAEVSQHQGKPIPWLMIGGGGALVLLICIGVMVMMMSGGAEPEVVGPAAPTRPAVLTDRSRGGAVFFDNFERQDPGLEYRLINSPPQSLAIQNGRLVLASTSLGTVRVDLIPKDRKPFEEVSARVAIQPGCRVIFGIINAARMTLTREGNEIEIMVTPGYPGTDPNQKRDWPRFEAPPGNTTIPIRLIRRRDQVVWSLGDNIVATSPELTTLGDPGITIETSGPAGVHAAVDDLGIWFGK